MKRRKRFMYECMECSLQYVRRRQINKKDMSVESVKETQTDIENILTVKTQSSIL